MTKSPTGVLTARLRDHYLAPTEMFPGGIFVEEVGANGGGVSRRCDAIYVGFTSSSGRIMIGHEVKVSRADWRHELDQPDKADPWSDACHAWYVVAPSTDIVPPEEVPAGWGLLVPNTRSKRRMTAVVKAAVKHDHTPPWWAVRSVMSRQDTMRGGDVTHRVTKALNEVSDDISAGRYPRHGHSSRIHDAIERAVRERAANRAGGDPESTMILRAFKEAGIRLASSKWDRTEGAITPEHLADPEVRELLTAEIELADLRKRILGRYQLQAVTDIADLAKELLTTCKRLAS